MERNLPHTMEDHIKLGQFLKWQGLVDSGGSAAILIREGRVRVNGEVDMRRGRKLRHGDVVQLDDQACTVDLELRVSPEAPGG